MFKQMESAGYFPVGCCSAGTNTRPGNWCVDSENDPAGVRGYRSCMGQCGVI